MEVELRRRRAMALDDLALERRQDEVVRGASRRRASAVGERTAWSAPTRAETLPAVPVVRPSRSIALERLEDRTGVSASHVGRVSRARSRGRQGRARRGALQLDGVPVGIREVDRGAGAAGRRIGRRSRRLRCRARASAARIAASSKRVSSSAKWSTLRPSTRATAPTAGFAERRVDRERDRSARRPARSCTRPSASMSTLLPTAKRVAVEGERAREVGDAEHDMIEAGDLDRGRAHRSVSNDPRAAAAAAVSSFDRRSWRSRASAISRSMQPRIGQPRRLPELRDTSRRW